MTQRAAAAVLNKGAAPAPADRADPKAAEVRAAMAQALPAVTALLASQWKARESGVFFNTHEAVPNAGTPFAHLLRPEFWGNVSQKMRCGDTIIALPRDRAWYAELIVWDAGMNWANVSVRCQLDKPEFAAMPGVGSDFDITRDPLEGWTVRRISTGAKVKGNFPNSEDARKWILDHQRALRS